MDTLLAYQDVHGGDSDVHSARGLEFHGVPSPAPVGNQSIPTNTIPTTSTDPKVADDGYNNEVTVN